MSLHIPAGTSLRVETHHDGSLTLRFDSRKRPLEPETTAIEETENADVTADVTAVADDAATTFTLKRHKTDVFEREDGPRQDARGNTRQRRENDSYRAHVRRAMRGEARGSPS